jgi:hypothetical protein
MGIILIKDYAKFVILLVSLVLGIQLNSAFLAKEIYFCTKTNALKYVLLPFIQIRILKNAKSVPLLVISVLIKTHSHVKYAQLAIIYQMGFA